MDMTDLYKTIAEASFIREDHDNMLHTVVLKIDNIVVNLNAYISNIDENSDTRIGLHYDPRDVHTWLYSVSCSYVTDSNRCYTKLKEYENLDELINTISKPLFREALDLFDSSNKALTLYNALIHVYRDKKEDYLSIDGIIE